MAVVLTTSEAENKILRQVSGNSSLALSVSYEKCLCQGLHSTLKTNFKCVTGVGAHSWQLVAETEWSYRNTGS